MALRPVTMPFRFARAASSMIWNCSGSSRSSTSPFLTRWPSCTGTEATMPETSVDDRLLRGAHIGIVDRDVAPAGEPVGAGRHGDHQDAAQHQDRAEQRAADAAAADGSFGDARGGARGGGLRHQATSRATASTGGNRRGGWASWIRVVFIVIRASVMVSIVASSRPSVTSARICSRWRSISRSTG